MIMDRMRKPMSSFECGRDMFMGAMDLIELGKPRTALLCVILEVGATELALDATTPDGMLLGAGKDDLGGRDDAEPPPLVRLLTEPDREGASRVLTPVALGIVCLPGGLCTDRRFGLREVEPAYCWLAPCVASFWKMAGAMFQNVT